jgi:hypothetical protein
MQSSEHGDGADYADQEAAEMGRILALGAAVGVPLVFVISLLMVFAAGARGAGTIFVAAWAALIGGTFIGAGILLSKRLGNLGSPQQSARASTRSPSQGAVSSQSPAGGERLHRPTAVEG